MYIIWLIFMALVIGYLAVPVLRELGYAYGRFGRLPDIVAVILGALFLGVVGAALLAALDIWEGGDTGALVLGFGGAMLVVLLLTIFSAGAAVHEDTLPKETNRPDN